MHDLKKLLDSLSQDKKQIEEISEYILYKNIKIGEGGSSSAFYGTDKNRNFEVAIKIENKKKALLCESLVLDNLNSIEKIPNKYLFISTKNRTILIQSIFGPTLKNLFSYQKDNFDLWTICEIGIQIVSILRQIHAKNFIHNDIKPSNICWAKIKNGSLVDKDKVFLIDFGLSKKINCVNKDNIKKVEYEGKIISYDISHKNKNFEGTAKYMAIEKAKGFNSSKGTDLEELLYTLIYLFKGSLAWDVSEDEEHKKNCLKQNKIKENYNVGILCEGLPEEFIVITKYILNIKPTEEPCYNTIIKLLESAKNTVLPQNQKEAKFSFWKNINEKFSKYNNNSLYDTSNDEIKKIFGEIPIDKNTLLN